MTTINTIEDLLRLLDENPEWLEALRSRLLTREVLEMPQTLARFIESTNQRLDALDENTNRRFDVLERRMDGMEQRIGGVESDVQVLQGTTARIERNIQRMNIDMGFLRASHARNAAVEEAYDIAREMGLRYVETLRREQVSRMVDENDTSGLTAGDLRSFRRADLVIRALEGGDRPCYITVEISYTANGRDTSRAIRNAGLLTRFTGAPAYPAIAGMRLDDRVRPQVDSGELFFYELEDEAMEVE